MTHPIPSVRRLAQLARPFAVVLALTLSLPAMSADDAVSGFYEDAVARFADDDLAGAVIQLKNALQRAPADLPSTLLLGRVYLAQGRGAAAEAMVRQAARLGADPTLSAALLGESLLLQHKFRELLAELDPTKFTGDVAADVYELRGSASLELNDLGDAESAFTAAMTLQPLHPGPVVGLARLAMKRGDMREAERLADEAVGIAPGDSDAASVKASIAHARGDLETALALYSKAIELDKHNTVARLARAGLLVDLERDAEASADVAVLEETAILNPMVYYLKSVLAERRGDQDAAREESSRTTVLVDELRGDYLDSQPPLLLAAALAHYKLVQLERARDFLSRYVERVPNAIGPRRLLGSIYLQQGELEAAQGALEPALMAAPDDVVLLTLLSSVYERRGMFQSSTELLGRALEKSGGAPEVRTRLGLSRLNAGDTGDGLDLLDEAFQAGKGHRPAGMAMLLWYLRERQFKEAVRVARHLVDSDPQNIVARNLLGSALVGTGDLTEARIQFERVVNADATYLPARINLAKVDRLRGAPDDARKRLEEILASRPGEVEALLELAALEESLGNRDGARDWLEKARSADLAAVKPRVRFADFLLSTGDAKKALEVAQEASGIAPDDPAVMRVLANAYIANDKREVAKAIYNDMATQAGFAANALVDIARLQVAIGAMDDALYSLEKAINGSPDNFAAQVGAIDVMLSAGKIERAEERALALRENHPDSATAHRLVAQAYLARGDCAQGIESLRRAIAIIEAEEHVVRLAQAMASCEQVDGAAEELAAWLGKYPKGVLARKALAEMHLRRGDTGAARAAYEMVAAEAPNDPGTLNNLAYLYLDDDTALALQYARRAHDADPTSSNANDTLGWTLLRSGDATAALPFLREAHSRDSRNPEILYHLAAALHQLGRVDEAKRQLRKALDAGQSFNGEQAARDLMQSMN